MKHPSNHRFYRSSRVAAPGRSAFTLIELMVTIAIVATLTGLLLPALSTAKTKAHQINAMSAAKQLMLAYQMYANDHQGKLMPGYRYGYEARDTFGNPITHPINARYPWRLAPYLGSSFEVMYVNRNRARLAEFRGDPSGYVYAASVFPSFGINSVYVGGDDLVLPPNATAINKFGSFCATRQSDALRPSELLVFSSARSVFQGRATDGFYRVEAPYLTHRTWAADYDSSMAAETFGFVHPRFKLKTVVGMLDGRSTALNLNEIQDMRYWAIQADRPDWKLKAKF